jgi:hypothetical protein
LPRACAGVKLVYNPAQISTREVLEILFIIHDPTTLNRQGNDSGTQYRSGIYYTTSEQQAVAQELIAEMAAGDTHYQTQTSPFCPARAGAPRGRRVVRNGRGPQPRSPPGGCPDPVGRPGIGGGRRRHYVKRMLILGGGITGLEMGTVYSTLGARLDVVEMLDGLMQGADRDLVKIWQKINAPRFDNIILKTKTVGAKATAEGIDVTFASAEEGGTAPPPQTYDLVLQAVGRTPNGKKIATDKAGVAVTDRGFIPVNIQMRTNVSHIFAIGDIVGQPMLSHKAVHEAHVAAEVIAGELQGNKELASSAFNARVIPSVAYTDPEVAAKLVRYSNNGSTTSAVNFPEVALPEHTYLATSIALMTTSTSTASTLLPLHHQQATLFSDVGQNVGSKSWKRKNPKQINHLGL